MLYFIFLAFAIIINANCLCPEGSYEWQTKCYFFVNITAGFANAESLCSDKNGHLASIHDGFTNALLAQKGSALFHESTMTDFWIGLSSLIIPGNWTWIDGTKLDFIDWASNEPQNITGNSCAALSLTNGQWKSDDCYKLKSYACAVEKIIFEPTTTTTAYPIFANCTRPFVYFEPTHSCYGVGVMTGNLNWSDSEAFCESYGGHLVSIHSYEEESLIYSFVSYSAAQTWSGLFSNDEGKTWKWSDGTPLDYNPWGFGHGTFANYSGCGLLHHDSITGENCSILLRVLCKIVIF